MKREEDVASKSRDPSPATRENESPPRRPPSVAHRIYHPPRLERKHSSGDLHSRLKTRKILGVGETDNGDIHRSKISQLLGHNEHLYFKFPKGYWSWHLAMTLAFTLFGLNNLFFPGRWFSAFGATEIQDSLSSRFYGCASLALALLLWLFWGTQDKFVAKSMLASVTSCITLQTTAMLMECWSNEGLRWSFYLSAAIRICVILTNAYFYREIGVSGSRIRKSNSFTDLRDGTSTNLKRD